MKLLTFLLLAMNASYFSWQLFLAREDGASVMVRSPAQQASRSLLLLGERESGRALAVPDSTYCARVGVFQNTRDSDAFVGQLKALGFQAEVELVEIDEQPDYWVHMPPFVSEAAARRRLEALKANDIDSFLIASGDLAMGISLGLFSRRESALLVQEQLAVQGYPASIREVPRSYSEIWVAISGLREEGFDDGQWQGFLETRPGLQQTEKLCETIAPTL